jgi:hypothetical protein
MQLKLFKSLWEYVRFEGNPVTVIVNPSKMEEHFNKIADSGYAGIECPLPGQHQESWFKEMLAKYKFNYIAQIITRGDYLQSFMIQARRAADFHPLKIVSHSAKDSMSYEDQLLFFRKAVLLEKEIGIAIAHETHRGRAMFTPWNTARLLNDVEELKITADLSHWCCVCESMLGDMEEHLALALSRAIHIHGRIGYEEGPQVPDPRAPEYAGQTEAHFQWWEQICVQQLSNNVSEITFTPEFGPPLYMHTLPYTNQPVADLWEVNLWMAQMFRERFGKLVTPEIN